MVETRPAMSHADKALYVFLSGALVAALAGFGFFYWARLPDWQTSTFTMSLFTVLLLLFVAQFVQAWGALPMMRRPLPPPPEPGLRVAMITTFVPSSEPLDMLEATLRGMASVRYPHDCWVLDEGDDEHVKRVCESLGVMHFSRKGRPNLNSPSGALKARTKYGNVNAWLQEVGYERYEVVSSFDPDHVPAPYYLERTLGYLRDPEVAYVQAAQVYYNAEAGLVARGAAEETYGYYSSTLMSGFGAGYVVAVGCHTTHRVTALRQIGGFAAHDADDLLAALHYNAAGWRGVYVPETLAIGLTPVDWPSYLTQQRRWARSVFDIKLRILPQLWRRLPTPVRWLSLNQGMSYFIELLLPVIGALLLCVILAGGDASVLPRLFGQEFLLLLLVLAAIDVFRQLFFLNPRLERGLSWRAGMLRQVKWWAVGRGIWEAFRGHTGLYEITSKVSSKASPFGALRAPLLLFGAVVAFYCYALAQHAVGHWSLHAWSILFGAVTLLLLFVAQRPAPPGFDARLLDQARAVYFAESAENHQGTTSSGVSPDASAVRPTGAAQAPDVHAERSTLAVQAPSSRRGT